MLKYIKNLKFYKNWASIYRDINKTIGINISKSLMKILAFIKKQLYLLDNWIRIFKLQKKIFNQKKKHYNNSTYNNSYF